MRYLKNYLPIISGIFVGTLINLIYLTPLQALLIFMFVGAGSALGYWGCVYNNIK